MMLNWPQAQLVGRIMFRVPHPEWFNPRWPDPWINIAHRHGTGNSFPRSTRRTWLTRQASQRVLGALE